MLYYTKQISSESGIFIFCYRKYIKPDLRVIFEEFDSSESINYNEESKFYYIIIFLDGHNEIIYKDKIYFTNPGDAFFASSYEQFTIKNSFIPVNRINIAFNPKIFRNKTIDDDFDILKSFHSIDKIKIYSKFTDLPIGKSVIACLSEAIDNHYTKAHIFSSVLQLICEIDKSFRAQDNLVLKETDSKFVHIISYIEEHIFEKITLQKVSDNTFISKRCIQNTIKKICNMTFFELVIHCRLKEAKKYIENNNNENSLSETAEKLGFTNYSTFYRQYLRYYGETPSQTIKNFNNQNKF